MSDFGGFDDEGLSEIPATLEEDRPGSGPPALYNVVSLLFLGLTGLSVLWMAAIFISPTAFYNPFPPGQELAPTAFVIPTLTPSPEIETLPPTWTPSVTPTPFGGATGEAPAEATPPGESTPGTPAGGEEASQGTPAPIPTAPAGQPTVSAFPFTLQPGSPAYTQYPDERGGCAFLGIAGQVFGLDGEPVEGIAVVVTGENFETIDITKFNTAYGAGSYEIQLNNAPIEAEFEVQLWSVSAQALSDRIPIRTRTACEENLIFVTFVQNHEY